jgi:general secretion pathway protein J
MKLKVGQGGFTLLELVISMTMMAIILLITGAAIRLGVKSADSGERRIMSLERFRVSLNIVDSQLQAELPLVTTGGDLSDNYVFKGDSVSMNFPSNFSLWGNLRGSVNVSYKVKRDQWGKQDLYVEEQSTGTASQGEVKLFEFFDRIYFEYFYKDPTEEQGNWVEEWENTQTVPEKIRLHLVNGATDMSFIIPLRVRDVTVKTQPNRST